MFLFSPLRDSDLVEVYDICRKENIKGKRHTLVKSRRHLTDKQEIILQYCQKFATWDDIESLLTTETSHEISDFVLYSNEVYRFANENIKNSFVAALCKHCSFVLPFIIATCDSEVLFRVIGQRYSDQTKKKSRTAFYKRIKLEWLNGKVARSVQHPIIARNFREFIRGVPKHEKKCLLCIPDEESGMLAIYHGMENYELKEKKYGARNVTEAILYSKCWRKIGKEYNNREHGKLAFDRACQLQKYHTVNCFRETMFKKLF